MPPSRHRRIARSHFRTRWLSSRGRRPGTGRRSRSSWSTTRARATASPGASSRDPDQAADATQDAFIHAYKAIGSYRGGIFRSWLLRITANASYDILRRAQRRPSSPLPDPDEGAPELPDLGAVNPHAEATKSEMYRHLEVALRRLPEDQRTAVVLCDVYGMDYNEVAAMTSSALGTVKSRIHRGRLRLRELLAEHRELFTG